jgi:triosephosphate isomerase
MSKVIKKIPVSKSIIVANWKNTPDSLKEAKKNFGLIKRQKINSKKIMPIICPADLHLAELRKSYSGSIFHFGAQDMTFGSKRPLTGENTAEQLDDLGVHFTIIGHSDRRQLGETNEMVSFKIKEAIDSGIMPILCIGELERDDRGEYLRFVEQELVESLEKIKKNQLDKIIIAYEPIFAIGKGHKAITTHEIHQMVIFIKKILARKFDKKTAMKVPILYGGSVDDENAAEILEHAEVRGLLIGRASANPHTFKEILKSIS